MVFGGITSGSPLLNEKGLNGRAESLAFDRTYLIGAVVYGVLQSLTFVLGIEALLLIIAGLYPVSLVDEGFDSEELFDELLADRQDIAELVEA